MELNPLSWIKGGREASSGPSIEEMRSDLAREREQVSRAVDQRLERLARIEIRVLRGE
jgi:hypothetical protein